MMMMCSCGSRSVSLYVSDIGKSILVEQHVLSDLWLESIGKNLPIDDDDDGDADDDDGDAHDDDNDDDGVDFYRLRFPCATSPSGSVQSTCHKWPKNRRSGSHVCVFVRM